MRQHVKPWVYSKPKKLVQLPRSLVGKRSMDRHALNVFKNFKFEIRYLKYFSIHLHFKIKKITLYFKVLLIHSIWPQKMNNWKA